MAKRKKPKNRKRREWTPPSPLKATKTPGADREKAVIKGYETREAK